MKRKELAEKALGVANETFPIMIKMSKYDESMFVGVVSAMIEMYAMLNNINKIELATLVYANLRTNDHE